jgi:hypothetical protein
MQAPARLRWATLAAGLWWGSLSALMLLVVPLLFMHLPSAQMAGSMAARLFSAQTWLTSLCCLLLLLVFNRAQDEDLLALGRAVLRPVIAGLLLALLVELALAPRILAARGQEGQSLRLWHGLASAMYLAQWLCALGVLWRLARRP